jgi:hypothetical protein
MERTQDSRKRYQDMFSIYRARILCLSVTPRVQGRTHCTSLIKNSGESLVVLSKG